MASPYPRIGDWYQTSDGNTLEVVAYDPDELTIEVQFYDGAVEEYDLDTWNDLTLEVAAPPEDWSGSMDLSQEDYGVDRDTPAGEILPSSVEEYGTTESEFED